MRTRRLPPMRPPRPRTRTGARRTECRAPSWHIHRSASLASKWLSACSAWAAGTLQTEDRMTDLPRTIVEAGEWLRAGRLSCTELTEGLLDRAEKAQSALGAFITIARESALAAAAIAGAELSNGNDRGPLHGIPIGVKDIIATVDAPTTANSRVLDPAWGAGRDAAVMARLRAAGAIMLGKLVLSEYAIG